MSRHPPEWIEIFNEQVSSGKDELKSFPKRVDLLIPLQVINAGPMFRPLKDEAFLKFTRDRIDSDSVHGPVKAVFKHLLENVGDWQDEFNPLADKGITVSELSDGVIIDILMIWFSNPLFAVGCLQSLQDGGKWNLDVVDVMVNMTFGLVVNPYRSVSVRQSNRMYCLIKRIFGEKRAQMYMIGAGCVGSTYFEQVDVLKELAGCLTVDQYFV